MRSSKKRNATLSKAEKHVWSRLTYGSWLQMQNLFPRLAKFTGPRTKYHKNQPIEEGQNG